jgi:hypothetical protein
MKTFCLILFFAILISCTSKNAAHEEAFADSMDSLNSGVAAIDEETVRSILEQIPSPLEISMLLKKSDTRYNSAILNSPDNISKYNSNYQKALNLGIYGADLGYSNIYGESMESIRYLSSIKTLANDLNIGQFFDIGTISKLASNSNNLDSLLLVTTQNFNAINRYLQSQQRSNLSLLFLIGGWVEAMEIICHVASQDLKNRTLIEGIGEQKIILEQMVLLLSLYEGDSHMTALTQDFKELKIIFDGINITYTYKESSMEVVDGVVLIKDNSTTTIDMTAQDALNIRDKISSIRSKIIS